MTLSVRVNTHLHQYMSPTPNDSLSRISVSWFRTYHKTAMSLSVQVNTHLHQYMSPKSPTDRNYYMFSFDDHSFHNLAVLFDQVNTLLHQYKNSNCPIDKNYCMYESYVHTCRRVAVGFDLGYIRHRSHSPEDMMNKFLRDRIFHSDKIWSTYIDGFDKYMRIDS